MIPGTCPDCGTKRPLSDYLADADNRAALAAALSVPAPLARLIISYLELHSPPARAVSTGKLRRLLVELAELISAGTVTRKRETRVAPLAAWQHGLETLLAQRDAGTLSLPLSGHGYLCEIIHRHVGQKASREQAANRPLHPSQRPFSEQSIERARVAQSGPEQTAAPNRRQAQHAQRSPQPVGAHLAGLKAALRGRSPATASEPAQDPAPELESEPEQDPDPEQPPKPKEP